MANLLNYLDWRGDISFEEVSFNKIDALVLAQISYILIYDLVSPDFDKSKTLKQLAEDFKADKDFEKRLQTGYVINKKTPEVLLKAAATKRFANVKITGLQEIFSKEEVEQFATMTYLIDDKVIVSFRGTDDTLIGWKEDFNIVWQDQIPAQRDALIYLENVSKAFKGKISILGHSKGGNLAVYTAVKSSDKIKNRLETIYNFEGPGFSKEFFQTKEFKKIENKLINIYPELSLVGMIFHHPEKYQIVESDGFAVMEHDALTWQIMGSDFISKPDFKDESKFFHKAFNEWVESLSKEQTKAFVTALWDVIMATDTENLTDMQKNPLLSGAKMFACMTSFDKNTKTEVKKIMDLLRTIVFKGTSLGKAFILKAAKA